MNYDIVKLINELEDVPVRTASRLFFDDLDNSARITEVAGNHTISPDAGEIYGRRLTAKCDGFVGAESLKLASHAFDANLGNKVKIWMLETHHFIGYVFMNLADEKIVAAPFGEKSASGQV